MYSKKIVKKVTEEVLGKKTKINLEKNKYNKSQKVISSNGSSCIIFDQKISLIFNTESDIYSKYFKDILENIKKLEESENFLNKKHTSKFDKIEIDFKLDNKNKFKIINLKIEGTIIDGKISGIDKSLRIHSYIIYPLYWNKYFEISYNGNDWSSNLTSVSLKNDIFDKDFILSKDFQSQLEIFEMTVI